jgi:hypothetical protein
MFNTLVRKRHFMDGTIYCPSRNVDFCSRLRHAKKITAGICVIFRGLFFEYNADIGQKDLIWMDNS